MQNHGYFLSIQTETGYILNTLKNCLVHSKQFIHTVIRVGTRGYEEENASEMWK